jgi:salicylate hydroxylase
VASSRNVIVAGAGIGGLSVALMLARSGFRATLVERAARLEETGAGIQLPPNASRILIALGLEQRLRRDAIAPSAVVVKTATGGKLTVVPLGTKAEQRYGAPYWCIHRGDLQAALLEAVDSNPDIALRLGRRVEDFVMHSHGVSAACRQASATADEHGIALIGADGLWSDLRPRLGNRGRPEFCQRTAWRALIDAERVAPEFRSDEVQLWLGKNAHLVHYPVKRGKLINMVAIVADHWSQPGWSTDGDRAELLAHFSPWNWCEPVREFLSLPERWLKWALYDLPPLRHWSEGAVTLMGDAAHPMLPFLAQGAAMAIEDAAVLAERMVHHPDDPATAFRRYERARRRRTARVQRAARRNGQIYHLAGAEALARNLALRAAGGLLLRRRTHWLYDWRFTPAGRLTDLHALPETRPDEEHAE